MDIHISLLFCALVTVYSPIINLRREDGVGEIQHEGADCLKKTKSWSDDGFLRFFASFVHHIVCVLTGNQYLLTWLVETTRINTKMLSLGYRFCIYMQIAVYRPIVTSPQDEDYFLFWWKTKVTEWQSHHWLNCTYCTANSTPVLCITSTFESVKLQSRVWIILGQYAVSCQRVTGWYLDISEVLYRRNKKLMGC